MARPADLRFYFDADILGLAHVVVGLRSDCTYPGDPGGVVHRRRRPPCTVTSPATKDHVWIPEVTRQGLLIVTRDRHIRDHRAEIAAVRDHGARMVALASDEAVGVWNQLEVLMTQWRAIEAKHAEAGPFIYSVSRTAMKAVDLS